MTQKIDLGKDPFGSFAEQKPATTQEVDEDVLSDLMQVGAATSDPVAPKNPVAPATPPVASAAAFVESAPTDVDPLPPADPEPTARAEPVPAPQIATTPLDGVRQPEPIDQRKLWLLRILLISNLAMMLVMLLLPHPMETRTEYAPSGPSTTGEGVAPRPGRATPLPGPGRATSDPFVQPERPQALGLPNDPLYETALMQALDGEFALASTTLQAFLAAHPDLDPALQRLVHAHLAYYLRKSGELAGAIEHETISRQMAGRAFLPEELLRSAREAELRGDGEAMRRAYAQFLLQEDQLPPALRALVQEAYLKLGDAYRVDADRGERSTPAVEAGGK